MNRTVETLEVLLQQEKEKNAQLEAISKGTGDSAETSKKQLAVLELRYQALCSAYCRRISELPRELFVLEQERKKIETEHQNKLIVTNQKLADAKSQEEAILNEMDKTGQGNFSFFVNFAIMIRRFDLVPLPMSIQKYSRVVNLGFFVEAHGNPNHS